MHRLAILALFAFAACSKNDPGPTCDQVVDHMLEITKQVMLGHDSMDATIRKQALAQCQQRKLSKQARECIMAAKDSTSLVACYRGEPGAPAPAPGMRPLPPRTGSGTGSGSGSGTGSGSSGAGAGSGGTPTP